jgi:hypothetical protein
MTVNQRANLGALKKPVNFAMLKCQIDKKIGNFVN